MTKLVLFIALLLYPPNLANAGVTRPLDVETFLHARMFSQDMLPVASPDGRWVAYTIVRRAPDPNAMCPAWPLGIDVACEVWVTNRQTGESIDMTGPGGEGWSPSWSSDASRLAFFSSDGAGLKLAIWDRTTRRLHTVSPSLDLEATTDAPQWVGANTAVAVRLHHSCSPAPVLPHKSTVTVLISPPSSGRISKMRLPGKATSWSSLGILNVNSGSVYAVETAGATNWFGVSPNERYLAYTTEEPSAPKPNSRPFSDLYAIDLLHGGSRLMVAHAQIPFLGPVSWSPDSRRLAFMTVTITRGKYIRINGDCFVVDITDPVVRNVTPGEHADFGYGQDMYVRPLWDPTGKHIYLLSFYYSAVHDGISPPGDSLWEADIDRPAMRRLLKIPGSTMLMVIPSSRNPNEAALIRQHDLLLLARDDSTKQAVVSAVNSITGKRIVRYEAAKALGNPTDLDLTPLFAVLAPDGTLLTAVQDSSHLSELWSFSSDFRSHRQLTNLNPWQREYSFGTSRVVTWHDKKGHVLHGALLLPKGYNPHRRYPLVVVLYPNGANSDAANIFGIGDKDVMNMQFFATRGYIALSADSISADGAPMKSVYETLMPGIDVLVREGIADSKRMAIMGESFGGYGVMSILVQTSQFAAAVDDSGGYIDWFSMAGAMEPDGGNVYGEIAQTSLGGTIWTAPMRYFENSPLVYLNRVQTPVLIAQGTAGDSTQSNELFTALERLGKRAEYAIYPNENHGTWQYHYYNLADFYHRVILWFDRYL